jgi:hypothetical protein
MKDIDRRSAVTLSLTAAAAVPGLVLVASGPAEAQTYRPDEGREVGPGVRVVSLGEGPSGIPAYKTVRLRDVVIQPGASGREVLDMMNDMLCHTAEGELLVRQNGREFTAPKGHVWTCTKGVTTEQVTNKGSTVAIMRTIDLIA